MKKLFAACLLVLTTIASASPWYSYVEGRGRYGDWRQGGSVDLFMPVAQDGGQILFSQSHAARLKHAWDIGTGIGYRSVCCHGVAWGTNLFIDYTQADGGRGFLQGGGGVELFGPCFEARVNGYLPTRTQTFLREESMEVGGSFVIGTEVFTTLNRESIDVRAFGGFEGELGLIYCVGPGYVRGYAGGYWFHNPHERDLVGPRFRLQYEWDNPGGYCGARLFAGAEYQYDCVRHSEAAVVGGIRVPFGCNKRKGCWKSSLCRRLGDLVHREPGVLTRRAAKQSSEAVPAIDPATGQQFQLIFAEVGGTGGGGQNNPTDLDDAVRLSRPGDVIFLVNDNGTFITNMPVPLMPDQQLLGFGSGSSVIIDFGGGVTVEVNGSGRAVIERNTPGTIVLANNNNLIQGIELRGGTTGIQGSGISGTLIRDVTFNQIGGTAIDIGNVAPPATAFLAGAFVPDGTSIQIDSVMIMQPTSHGIMLEDTEAVKVSRAEIVSPGGDGIRIKESTEVTIDLTEIRDATGMGIMVIDGDGPTVKDTKILDGLDDGLRVIGANGGSYADLEIMGNSGRAANFIGVTGSHTLSGGTISGNANGIAVFDGSGTLDVTNVAMMQTSGFLFDVDDYSGTFTQSGAAAVLGDGTTGITVANSSGSINFDGVELANGTATQFFAEINTGPVTLANSTLRDGTGIAAIFVGQTGPFTASGNQITDFNSPNPGAIVVDDSTGAVLFSNNTMTDLTTAGTEAVIAVSSTGSNGLDFTATGNTITNPNDLVDFSMKLDLVGNGISHGIDISNNPAISGASVGAVEILFANSEMVDVDITVNSNMIDAGDRGVRIAESGMFLQNGITYDISGNTITTMTGATIQLSLVDGGDDPNTLIGTTNGNTLSSLFGDGITAVLNGENSSNVFAPTVNSNMITVTSSQAAINFSHFGEGSFIPTFNSNSDLSNTTGPAFVVSSSGTSGTPSKTTCITASGNSVAFPGAPRDGITINRFAGLDQGTVDVVDLTNLSTINNGITVTLNGLAPTNVGSCPTP